MQGMAKYQKAEKEARRESRKHPFEPTMRILLARYMVDVEVYEPLCHANSCVMIGC